MADIKVRYFVERRNDDGSLRFYWKPWAELQALGWRTERLKDEHNTPFSKPEHRGLAIAAADKFNARLDAWREGRPDPTLPSEPAKPNIIRMGTLAHAIRQYKASEKFKEKGDKTRRGYEQNLQVLEAWGGDVTIAAIGPARVQALYTAFKQRTPSKARAVVGMLRILLAFAIRTELLPAGSKNAAEKPDMTGAKQSGLLWPTDAVAMFLECADRPTDDYPKGWHSVGTAVLVNHWIGQRQADVLAMQRTAYRDGRFYVAQKKSGGKAKVAVPHSPWIQARIEAELARQKARGIEGMSHLLLCETTGQPWKEDMFRHVFAEIRGRMAKKWPAFEPNHNEVVDQEPVPAAELLFMHLRHTAVTELAIAGVEVPGIAAITGHTIKSVETILERYLVRTSEAAAAATDKRMQNSAELLEIFGAPKQETK